MKWSEKRKLIARGLRELAERIEHREHEELKMKEYGNALKGLLGVIATQQQTIQDLSVKNSNLTAAAPDSEDAAELAAAQAAIAAAAGNTVVVNPAPTAPAA